MSNHPKTGQPNASEAIHELDLGEVAGGANPSKASMSSL